MSLALLLAAPAPALFAGLPQSDDELTPTAMAMVNEAQEEVLRLHFERARGLCAQAQALAPEHPLPLVMDVGVRLYEIQENLESGKDDAKAFRDFYAKDDALVRMAEARQAEYPKSPYPKLALGAAYGCRGLVKLYQHSYVKSYLDGKRGVGYLQQAVALDPSQYNAYMGLGQFEYYCARLNGLLQYILDLQGDEKRGIAMLKLCESKGSYSAWAGRTFLTKILIYDQRSWEEAAPYLERVYKAFPENYQHLRMVATFAQGYGMDKAESRELMELACVQWDQGWRPPAHLTGFPFESSRLELAQYYLKKERSADARRHLQALTHSEDTGLARTASSLLSKLK